MKKFNIAMISVFTALVSCSAVSDNTSASQQNSIQSSSTSSTTETTPTTGNTTLVDNTTSGGAVVEEDSNLAERRFWNRLSSYENSTGELLDIGIRVGDRIVPFYPNQLKQIATGEPFKSALLIRNVNAGGVLGSYATNPITVISATEAKYEGGAFAMASSYAESTMKFTIKLEDKALVFIDENGKRTILATKR